MQALTVSVVTVGRGVAQRVGNDQHIPDPIIQILCWRTIQCISHRQQIVRVVVCVYCRLIQRVRLRQYVTASIVVCSRSAVQWVYDLGDV